jgi:preprotein translocase SecE subunit
MARTRKTAVKRSREFDPSRWAHVTFVVGGFLVAWIFSHLVEDVWAFVWSQWPQMVGRPNAYWSKGGGIVAGVILTFWAWRKEEYFKFISEVATEVSQIVWPTRAETKQAVFVVIVITLICSGLLSVMDLVWSNFTDYLYAL